MLKKIYITGILIFFSVIITTIFYTQYNTIQNKENVTSHLYNKPLTIISKDKEHNFKVALAVTPRQRQLGLMFVKNLPKEAAMLFLFEQAETQAFWMKDTYIPLDILYIDEKGRIDQIVHNARPHDRTSIISNNPAKAVLEINGGLSKKLGITEGDHIKLDIIP